jgi:hypothetical protein
VHRLAIISAILFMFAPFADGRADNDKTGKYLCYQQGEAVLFGRGMGVRVTQLPENDQKFLIKVSPIKRPEWAIRRCKEDVSKALSQLESGEAYKDDDFREGIGWLCFTKDELRIGRGGGNELADELSAYRAYRLQFEFFESGGDKFSLFDDLSYERIEAMGGSPEKERFSYGKCEKISD